MPYKRMICAALAALLFAGIFSGCKKEDNSDNTTSAEISNTTEAMTEKSTTVETTAETTAETTQETTMETTQETTMETTQEITEEQRAEKPDVEVEVLKVPEAYQPESHAIAGAVSESAPVSSSYFDDVVFVGDSVSLKLSYYEAAVNRLGNAQFLTSGSLGSGNALWSVSNESVHPSYQGQKMLLEESIPLTGAKKLYIMLGMNDIALYGIDTAVSNMVALIGKIKAAVPDMKIYIQSMTPIAKTSNILSSGGLNPKNIRRYNEALAAVCQSNGWYFVNVGEVMYDSDGYLREDFCSDYYGMGIHFTDVGCSAWIEYLYTHTAG